MNWQDWSALVVCGKFLQKRKNNQKSKIIKINTLLEEMSCVIGHCATSLYCFLPNGESDYSVGDLKYANKNLSGEECHEITINIT